VKARCNGKHTIQVTALHYGQLAVHVGKADGTLVLRLGKSGVGGFAEELHRPRTEPPQGFQRERAECMYGAVVVGKEVSALVGIPKSSGMARGAGAGTNVGSSQGMDERDVGENVARPWAQVAVKVPAFMGAVGCAGRKPGVSPFSARGGAQAAHELTRNSRVLVMAALHETAKPDAA
jgi:hypothetical protein